MTNPSMEFARALCRAPRGERRRATSCCAPARGRGRSPTRWPRRIGRAADSARPRSAFMSASTSDRRHSSRWGSRSHGGAAAVVTTSGTAAGNLLPAVMEAHHSGVRLIAITADRPFDLRATGANQTTDQRRLFGPFVRHAQDVLAPGPGRDLEDEAPARRRGGDRLLGRGARPSDGSLGPGPVHLNVQFADPLGPDRGPWPSAAHRRTWSFAPDARLPGAARCRQGRCRRGRPGRIGARVHRRRPRLAPARRAHVGVARAGRPSSPTMRGSSRRTPVARWSPRRSSCCSSAARRSPAASGRSSTPLRGCGSPATAPRGARRPFARRSSFPTCRSGGSARRERPRRREWVERWVGAVEPVRPPGPGRWSPWRRRCWRRRANGPLVVGSSRAIRAVDAAIPADFATPTRVVIANRGLAGIDGTLSTALGVALGSEALVTALVGDLTFLHDAGGLLVGTRERRPSVRIVVLNDGGGSIFRGLEHAESEPGAFERVFTTPHGADLSAIAHGFGASTSASATPRRSERRSVRSPSASRWSRPCWRDASGRLFSPAGGSG